MQNLKKMYETHSEARAFVSSVLYDPFGDHELDKLMGLKTDEERVQQATAWLESLPEDVIKRGKWTKIRYNSGVRRYPESHWDEYPELFDAYIERLAVRKQEILAVAEIKDLIGLFAVFEVEEMLLYKPELVPTCPKFILKECFKPIDVEDGSLYPFDTLEMLCVISKKKE
ncbi:hypothetical protein J5491_01990 [Candidatus Saccharibacteria bacterium]|nr:hypothetical protein [Candidatus Saccharibacteria bacterium]